MTGPEAVLERIAARRPVLIDLGLERMFAALEALGDPHRRLPPVFHIAGTNGKGSTIAYLKAILEAAGKSVHVFTSPHLVRFNERIVLAGREISDDYLIDVLTRCDREVGSKSLTFFEATTCAAFLAFAETPADYLILETGLGGRLDATNVVDRPLAALITPVAYDHQQFLGHSIEEIAAEKAGIFRAGAPAVVGPQSPGAMQALAAAAARIGADLFAYGHSWNVFAEHGRLVYQDEDGLCDLSPPRLLGNHQIPNAGLAIAGLRAAGFDLDDAVLSAGVEGAVWPARLQRLKRGPIVDYVQAQCAETEVWLDGGHNPHAAQALAAALGDLEEKSPRPLVLISGMQETKDHEGFFAPFPGIARAVFTVQADHEGAAPAAVVAAAAERAGLAARPCVSIDEAVRLAAESKQAIRILICGSLYLAGEILRDNA
jgi:dihydrofolate synthase/folylpolyglutamate synthase